MAGVSSRHTLARHIFPTSGERAIAHWEHHAVASDHVFYHYHPQFELNLMEVGRARRVAGDREGVVRGRQLILIGPYLPHRWEIDASSSTAEFWVLAFSRESIGEDLLSRAEFRPLHRLLSPGSNGLVFSDATCEAVSKPLKSIGQASGLRRAGLVTSVFELICDDANPAPLTSPEYHSSAAEADHRFVNRIVDFYMHPEQLLDQRVPSLSEAADIAGVSVPTFTRTFRRTTGDSLVHYITRLRVARACTLLETTDDKIASVAAECGFGNLSHFNRQFRRHVAMSPREYRKSLGPS
jgi:AraC-like DNA-binding protein